MLQMTRSHFINFILFTLYRSNTCYIKFFVSLDMLNSVTEIAHIVAGHQVYWYF
jgi:hypothetical protein